MKDVITVQLDLTWNEEKRKHLAERYFQDLRNSALSSSAVWKQLLVFYELCLKASSKVCYVIMFSDLLKTYYKTVPFTCAHLSTLWIITNDILKLKEKHQNTLYHLYHFSAQITVVYTFGVCKVNTELFVPFAFINRLWDVKQTS